MTPEQIIEAIRKKEKIRQSSWESGRYIHLVDGYLVDQDGNFGNYDMLNSTGVEIYKEPKKKVKLYQYLYKYYAGDSYFNKSSYYFPLDVSEEEIRKHLFLAPDSILKRLDSTMIEVEE